jgi:predicted DNA-binding protein
MSEKQTEGRDPNRLIERVDALMKRQQEDSQRAVEEVPLLTEIVAHDAVASTPEAVHAEKALAADIERVLVVRLVPELNKQIAGLRSELEKELRRSVREAVEHALAARKANPDRS